MDIQSFIRIRPYLYHLTFAESIPEIINRGRIFCTNRLLEMSSREEFKRIRRSEHVQVVIAGTIFKLRDQRPISEKALSKCLTHDWTCEDYYEYLNNRVFTWPTLERLQRHYQRYILERPKILRFSTEFAIPLNPNPKFCRLNSGATRANSYLGGIPPYRGPETFLSAHEYELSPNSVAEVTFENEFILPNEFCISDNPGANWKVIRI